jgi:hypothetical protein
LKLEERYDVIPDPFLGSLRRKTLSAASSTELQDFSDPGDCAELSIESIGTCKKDNRLDLIKCKGVSDLETCVDYFVILGRSCEKIEFSRPVICNEILLRKIYQHPKKYLV